MDSFEILLAGYRAQTANMEQPATSPPPRWSAVVVLPPHDASETTARCDWRPPHFPATWPVALLSLRGGSPSPFSGVAAEARSMVVRRNLDAQPSKDQQSASHVGCGRPSSSSVRRRPPLRDRRILHRVERTRRWPYDGSLISTVPQAVPVFMVLLPSPRRRDIAPRHPDRTPSSLVGRWHSSTCAQLHASRSSRLP